MSTPLSRSVSCGAVFQILFYLQPLSATGPLVSAIRYVFRDITAFAILHALVVVGFGFSFLVLFADVFQVEDYGYFSTPLRSFETLFYAALGEFDSEASRQTSPSGSNVLYLSSRSGGRATS